MQPAKDEDNIDEKDDSLEKSVIDDDKNESNVEDGYKEDGFQYYDGSAPKDVPCCCNPFNLPDHYRTSSLRKVCILN